MSLSALPFPVRALLRLAGRLVPRSVRAEWVAEWHGELHYLRQVAGPAGTGADLVTLRRSLGCVTDAVWIRTHEWSPEMLLQDLRFALRTHLKRPGFAAVAVVTLALGIGANTALFSIVNGILLAPLPYDEPDQLVRLYGTNSARGLTASNLNPNDLLDVADDAGALVAASYYGGLSGTTVIDGQPMRLSGGTVHSSFFEVLRVQPFLGRFFTAAEDTPGNANVIVISHDTWQTLFGGDPDIVGRQLEFNEPYTIVGVAPPDFRDPFAPRQAMWSPWARDHENRGGHFMRAIGRLAPGVTVEQAQQEIDAAYVGVAEAWDKPQRGIRAESFHESVVLDTRPLILTLFGAVGFLLLIVCANVASLMLARAMNRQQEVAVRMALGAGRSRLVRQLVTESLVLAGIGGALGLALGWVLVELANNNPAGGLTLLFDIGLDTRVVAFSLLVTAAAGVLFGLAPAIQSTRRDLADSLRERSGDANRPGRGGLRAGLVVAEVALSLILLVGAGLMVRSLGNLMAVDPGFEAEGVLSFRISVPEADYPEYAEVPLFYDRLFERLRGLPGIESVGATNRLPFSGSYSCDFFMLEGWAYPEPGEGECAEERVVAGDYFGTLGIEIVDGRPLEEADGADGQRVVLVSQTMADRFMPGEDPLGRGFTWGAVQEDTNFRRVVGVVRDVKHQDLAGDAMTEVYMPHEQYPYYRTMFVVLRAADPLALLPAVREELLQLDPNIPIYQVAALADLVDTSLAQTRIGAQVLAVFATVALILACVGLYGVLALTVSQRTREFGVRMALGARGNDVVSMVLRQAMLLVVIGVGLGLAGAWAVSGALTAVLFEVQPGDPTTYAGVAALLMVIAAVAAWLPARRATRVDPVRALRED